MGLSSASNATVFPCELGETNAAPAGSKRSDSRPSGNTSPSANPSPFSTETTCKVFTLPAIVAIPFKSGPSLPAQTSEETLTSPVTPKSSAPRRTCRSRRSTTPLQSCGRSERKLRSASSVIRPETSLSCELCPSPNSPPRDAPGCWSVQRPDSRPARIVSASFASQWITAPFGRIAAPRQIEPCRDPAEPEIAGFKRSDAGAPASRPTMQAASPRTASDKALRRKSGDQSNEG